MQKKRKSIVSVCVVAGLLPAPHSDRGLYSSLWRLDITEVLIGTTVSIVIGIFFIAVSAVPPGREVIIVSVSSPIIVSIIGRLLCAQDWYAIILFVHVVPSGFPQISLIVFLKILIFRATIVIFGIEYLFHSIIGESRMQIKDWIFLFLSWNESHFWFGTAVVGFVDVDCISLLYPFQWFFWWTIEDLLFCILWISKIFSLFLSEVRFRLVSARQDFIGLCCFGIDPPVFLFAIYLLFQTATCNQ